MVLKPDKYFWYKIQEKYERLGLREWLTKNARIAIPILVAFILLSFIALLVKSTPDTIMQKEIVHKAWFYDLNTKQLFVDEDTEIPPIAAPSGPLPDGQHAGVRAHVYCRGFGENQSKPFIGFLETYKTEPATASDPTSEPKNTRLIKRPKDEEWIIADSYMGRIIMDEIFKPDENGNRLHYYSPK